MSSFLQNYQRQPKLFIDLPSKGKWYDETVLDGGQFTQIPVFGMNAMDEIMFKTPDALFTGEATAQVIRSCIPTILDPWRLVGYDIDYVLVALRVATYGDKLGISTMCPKCQHTTDSEVSLTNLLGNFSNYETEYSFQVGELTFNLAPISYKQTTDFSIENYTLDRQLAQIKTVDPTKENAKELDKQLQTIYNASSKLNMSLAISHIESIVGPDGEEERDLNVIAEFIHNNDAEFYKKLKDGIHDLTRKWNLPNIDIECGAEDCDNKYKSALDVDYSNFFGVRSLRSRNLIS
jgi:hypothetical protein